MIGPSSLGLLLDAIGVSLLSFAVFSTNLKLKSAVEQSIAEIRAPRLGPGSPAPASYPGPERGLQTLERERRAVARHLWIIVIGCAFVICGLTSQLTGTWPN